mmetsp:Transcript_10160/g.32303  ORF Transcript_10160/g.32303 Transcript_10160/m.32303 type:complete len:248 (-) Transcript_10160:2624-3367(-)
MNVVLGAGGSPKSEPNQVQQADETCSALFHQVIEMELNARISDQPAPRPAWAGIVFKPLPPACASDAKRSVRAKRWCCPVSYLLFFSFFLSCSDGWSERVGGNEHACSHTSTAGHWNEAEVPSGCQPGTSDRGALSDRRARAHSVGGHLVKGLGEVLDVLRSDACHADAAILGHVDVVLVAHAVHLLHGDARVAEHADLVGHVLPVARRARLVEVALEKLTHLDDAVRHLLALAVPLGLELGVLENS